jgi:nucleoside-diphosphate-sugar epimerase
VIIGNGIIANSFTNIDHSNLCIFASGVSNSLETDQNKFDKEFNLLKKTIIENPNKKLIYFSTISIEVKGLTPYTEHKLKLEQYIEQNCNNYLILRLSNIVSYNQPKHQLIGYFYDCLINRKSIEISPSCKRSLIDIDDLPSILEILINKVNNKVISVYFSNEITIKEILDYLEKITTFIFNIKNIKNINENKTDNSEFLNLISGYEHKFNINPFDILEKYYTK